MPLSYDWTSSARAILGVGGILVLVGGIVEAAIGAQLATYSVIGGAATALGAVLILLSLLVLALALVLDLGASPGFGTLFVLLGAIVLLLGGGFVAGPLLIVLAGVLILVFHGLDDLASQVGPTGSALRDRLAPEATPVDATAPSYRFSRPCSSCGAPNMATATACGRCGTPFHRA